MKHRLTFLWSTGARMAPSSTQMWWSLAQRLEMEIMQECPFPFTALGTTATRKRAVLSKYQTWVAPASSQASKILVSKSLCMLFQRATSESTRVCHCLKRLAHSWWTPRWRPKSANCHRRILLSLTWPFLRLLSTQSWLLTRKRPPQWFYWCNHIKSALSRGNPMLQEGHPRPQNK